MSKSRRTSGVWRAAGRSRAQCLCQRVGESDRRGRGTGPDGFGLCVLSGRHGVWSLAALCRAPPPTAAPSVSRPAAVRLTRTRGPFGQQSRRKSRPPLAGVRVARRCLGPRSLVCWVLWRRRVDRALGWPTRPVLPREGGVGQVLTALGPGRAAAPSVSAGPGRREPRVWTQAPPGLSLESGHYLLGGSGRAPSSRLGARGAGGAGRGGRGREPAAPDPGRCAVWALPPSRVVLGLASRGRAGRFSTTGPPHSPAGAPAPRRVHSTNRQKAPGGTDKA